nr:LOW QUALITY PROTEIN: zinc finger protein 425 [Aedes albopictus]
MSFQSSGNSAVCRVCRRDKNGSAPFVSLFLEDDHHQDDTGSSRGGAKATLASMLEFVGSVSVLPEEVGMPQEICVPCVSQLKAAYSFRKLCLESDELLRKRSKRGLIVDVDESQQQPSPTSSGRTNNSLVYLQNYDPSFYELTLDRYYYMELTFLALRCCGCRQAFVSSKDLETHSNQVHKKNQLVRAPHQCPICYSHFPYEDALRYHHQALQSNVFCCRECYLVFEKKHTLFGHLRSEHGRAEYELERDMYEEEHQPMEHSIFDPDPEPTLLVSNVQSLADPNADPYSMGYCEITSDLKLSDLRPTQYRLAETTEGFSIIEFTWHRCCACNHMFRTQADLDVHCTEEHRLRYNQNSTINVQSKPFLCEFCWRRFKKKSLLALHQKFNRKKTYSCNRCLHIFFGGPAYEKHLPMCGGQSGAVTSVDETTAAAVYVGHPMMKEEPEEDPDDDVYILND